MMGVYVPSVIGSISVADVVVGGWAVDMMPRVLLCVRLEYTRGARRIASSLVGVMERCQTRLSSGDKLSVSPLNIVDNT